MPSDRRLIEDFIPIREISAEASREKSIRKGHISTLHLWWARRPLVAARAAVYASLVPAPTTPEERAEYEREMIALCKWELGDDVLQRARERILAANGGVPPKVLDMFAGGGAIPLEALRLGCEAYAVDLNPVAHLIQLCTLVYPQQFGPKLAEEVERWGRWVLERVKAEIGDLYPPIPASYLHGKTVSAEDDQENDEHELEPPALQRQRGRQSAKLITEQHDMFASSVAIAADELNPVAYLWTRTVRCPNPTCGATVPLLRQTWLAKKKNYFVALKMHADGSQTQGERRARFEVVAADSEAGLGFDPAAFSERGNALCPFCGSTVGNDYVKVEGKAKRMGTQPMAIVCTFPGRRGKVYLSADEVDSALLPDEHAIQERIAQLCAETGLTVPEEPLPPQGTLGFRVQAYGLTKWHEIFSSRQILMLLTFCKFVGLLHKEGGVNALPSNLSVAISTSLGMWVDRLADFSSMLCTLKPGGGRGVVHTFTRQALPMVWDFAEINPFCNTASNAEEMLEWLGVAFDRGTFNLNPAKVHRSSATRLDIPDKAIDAVITDPPYYDNVPYADLSDFFYIALLNDL